MGPKGQYPILFLLGVITKSARTTPSITQIERLKDIEGSIVEEEKVQELCRISFGLRTTGVVQGVDSSEKLKNLAVASKFLLYRTNSHSGEGPFTCISVEGDTTIVQLKFGRNMFGSSCFTPYVKSLLANTDSTNELPDPIPAELMTSNEQSGI